MFVKEWVCINCQKKKKKKKILNQPNPKELKEMRATKRETRASRVQRCDFTTQPRRRIKTRSRGPTYNGASTHPSREERRRRGDRKTIGGRRRRESDERRGDSTRGVAAKIQKECKAVSSPLYDSAEIFLSRERPRVSGHSERKRERERERERERPSTGPARPALNNNHG